MFKVSYESQQYCTIVICDKDEKDRRFDLEYSYCGTMPELIQKAKDILTLASALKPVSDEVMKADIVDPQTAEVLATIEYTSDSYAYMESIDEDQDFYEEEDYCDLEEEEEEVMPYWECNYREYNDEWHDFYNSMTE